MAKNKDHHSPTPLKPSQKIAEDDLACILKKERERFADFQRATTEWWWETDENHRFTYMSESVREITGVAPEWHYGKSREDLGFREQLGEKKWAEFQNLIKNHKPFKNLTYARRGPDSINWIQTSGVPFFDDQDKFCGYRGVGRNITALVETEQMATQLATAVENMNEYFALWDAEDNLFFANKQFKIVNGLAPEADISGIQFAAHIRTALEAEDEFGNVEAREELIKDRVARHLNPGAPFEFVRPNGLTVLINEQRLPDGITATIATDITKLKEIERDRSEKAEIVDIAFRTIPDGILVLGPDNQPVTWNDHLFSLFDLKHLKILDSGEIPSALLNLLVLQIDTSQGETAAVDMTSFILNPDQHSHQEFMLASGKWIEFRGSPMAGGGYIMTFRDFSERRELDRLKSQFISTVSHELRTPLTSILGSLGLVIGGAAGEISEAARELIGIGVENSERLLKLINDILDLEKISQKDFQFEFEKLSVFEIMNASLKANLGFAERFDIHLRMKTEADDCVVKGDRHRLMQVMDNLISNAVKFSEPDGEVEILVSKEDNLVRISVTDQGPGIPKKFQDRIFDRFVQVDSSDTRSVPGTGLGLSICKEIISAHDGKISLYSQRNIGSTFYFELPIEN